MDAVNSLNEKKAISDQEWSMRYSCHIGNENVMSEIFTAWRKFWNDFLPLLRNSLPASLLEQRTTNLLATICR